MYQMSTNDIGTWDDFLGYDSGGLGSGGKTFLENWKKGGKGSADVWLYVGKVSAPVPPRPLWHHPWHKIEVRENKETRAPVRELWSDRIVSADSPELHRTRFLFDDSGVREFPPVACPFGRMIETIRGLVHRGKLDWKTPVFVFEPDDQANRLVIHAGGIYNGFKDAKDDSAEFAELKAADIHPGTAWRESALVKLQYVFCVLDARNPTSGLKITIEPNQLGQKTMEVIDKSRKGAESKSDPNGQRGYMVSNPFAIRWTFDKSRTGNYGANMYDAIKLHSEVHPLTPAIEAMIRGPMPDIARYVELPDYKTLRARLEHAATPALNAVIDWDVIFDVPAQKQEARREERVPEKIAEPSRGRRVRKVEPEPSKDWIACNKCDKIIDPKAAKCPHCGQEYEFDDDEPATAAQGKPAATPVDDCPF